MKKIILYSCMFLLLMGCGKVNSKTNIAESSSDAKEELEVLDDATLTIPSAIIGDELNDTNVIISDTEVAKENEIVLSISGVDRTKVLEDVLSEIDALAESIQTEKDLYPDIVSMETNENKTEFIVYTSSTDLNSAEGMLIMSLYDAGDKFQIYSGLALDSVNTNVKYVNNETKETFFEGNSSESRN